MSLQVQAESKLPTEWGDFRISCYTWLEQKATIIRLGTPGDSLLCRVHSQCLTGESLGSLRCDCKAQLDTSLKLIQESGSGVVFYLHQEGRGIGLENKIKAYGLQDDGMDTLEANLSLGLPADDREYSMVTQILKSWSVKSVELLTNNPLKVAALEQGGIEVKRLPLWVHHDPTCESYLSTKQTKMGHIA